MKIQSIYDFGISVHTSVSKAEPYKRTNSPRLLVYGTLLLLTFMTAMKYPGDSDTTTYTYLALGDSYTIGEQVPEQQNFPNQVRQILATKDVEIEEPSIIAKTGWTTNELQEGIDRANIVEQYDFVTLLIGVNNQYRGWEKNEYALEFESLLKQAIQFAHHDPSRVIVLSIPDWGITPFAEGRNRVQIGHEIDAFNAINKRIAEQYDVHYIDITPNTRKAAKDPSLLAPDGLHPSGKEYASWAEKVAEIVENII